MIILAFLLGFALGTLTAILVAVWLLWHNGERDPPLAVGASTIVTDVLAQMGQISREYIDGWTKQKHSQGDSSHGKSQKRDV